MLIKQSLGTFSIDTEVAFASIVVLPLLKCEYSPHANFRFTLIQLLGRLHLSYGISNTNLNCAAARPSGVILASCRRGQRHR